MQATVPLPADVGAGLDVGGNHEDFDGEVSFTDIVDKLEFAMMVHFEGRKGKAGFFVDAAYLSTEDSTTIPPNTMLPGGADVESGVTMGRYEGAGSFSIDGRQTRVDNP